MDELLQMTPAVIIKYVGIAGVMGILVILGTIFQKWGETLYKKITIGTREKRHGDNSYTGIERRSEHKNLENAITQLVDAMANNQKQFTEFLQTWKQSHYEMKESVEEIKRQQKSNWKRLFDEELVKFKEKNND